MWSSNILRKDFESGNLRVIVEYTDGRKTFSETEYIRRAGEIDARIKTRLKELEAIDAVDASLVIGPFTPTPDTPQTQTPLQIALAELARLEALVRSGIIQETDTEYIAALTAAKTAYANQ